MVEHCNKPLRFVETGQVFRVYLVQMRMTLLPSAVDWLTISVCWQLFASCLLTEAVFSYAAELFLAYNYMLCFSMT